MKLEVDPGELAIKCLILAVDIGDADKAVFVPVLVDEELQIFDLGVP